LYLCNILDVCSGGVFMSILTSIALGLKSLFSSSGAGETALKIVEKISGTDWNPQQQADFIIAYQNATKHMSLARRVIAISFVTGFALFGFVWLCSTVTYHVYMFASVSGETLAQLTTSQNLHKIKAMPLLQLSNDISVFLKDIFKEPMTWILSFYFVIDIGTMIKK